MHSPCQDRLEKVLFHPCAEQPWGEGHCSRCSLAN